MFNVVFVVSGTNPCLYNGVTYANGAEFAAMDGCNECECANAVTTCSTEVCGNSGKWPEIQVHLVNNVSK